MTVEQIRKVLATKKVGIAGAGGLGSNCAEALVRCGIGQLVVADFDVVSESNLNRQFYFRDQVGMKKTEALEINLKRVDPAAVLEMYPVRITADNVGDLFADCDVVVEAFDMADQKEMLIEAALSIMPDKPLILGLGIAGWGRSDAIQCRKSGNLYICGDEISEISPDLPPLAPRVGIVANMQANVVLEILLSEE
jgi:sulfur carrier protein ThiS adenylyltransferase